MQVQWIQNTEKSVVVFSGDGVVSRGCINIEQNTIGCPGILCKGLLMQIQSLDGDSYKRIYGNRLNSPITQESKKEYFSV